MITIMITIMIIIIIIDYHNITTLAIGAKVINVATINIMITTIVTLAILTL